MQFHFGASCAELLEVWRKSKHKLLAFVANRCRDLAFVQHLVRIAILAGLGLDITEVWNAVIVAIWMRGECDVAIVRLAVSITILIAFVRDAISVAVVARDVGDVNRIGTAVGVAILAFVQDSVVVRIDVRAPRVLVANLDFRFSSELVTGESAR